MNKLDFIVIGAAKSGTTTLFELMNQHPEIQMPSDKEAPYYTEPYSYSRGLNWYLNKNFNIAKKGPLKGTITPQYMLGKDDNNPEIVAKRIHKDFPNIKLLAILRNPIERSFSHHKMLKQRGVINDDFDTSVKKLLDNEERLESARVRDIRPENAFFTGSEYGRILSYYYKLFNSDQILVLFLDDLKRDPSSTLNTILTFLGVDNTFEPDKTDVQARKGGVDAKIKLLTPGVIYKVPLLKKAWNSIMPPVIRKKVEYKINLWNIKPDNSSIGQSDVIYKYLVKFFKEDVALLESLIDRSTPWSDWK